MHAFAAPDRLQASSRSQYEAIVDTSSGIQCHNPQQPFHLCSHDSDNDLFQGLRSTYPCEGIDSSSRRITPATFDPTLNHNAPDQLAVVGAGAISATNHAFVPKKAHVESALGQRFKQHMEQQRQEQQQRQPQSMRQTPFSQQPSQPHLLGIAPWDLCASASEHFPSPPSSLPNETFALTEPPIVRNDEQSDLAHDFGLQSESPFSAIHATTTTREFASAAAATSTTTPILSGISTTATAVTPSLAVDDLDASDASSTMGTAREPMAILASFRNGRGSMTGEDTLVPNGRLVHTKEPLTFPTAVHDPSRRHSSPAAWPASASRLAEVTGTTNGTAMKIDTGFRVACSTVSTSESPAAARAVPDACLSKPRTAPYQDPAVRYKVMERLGYGSCGTPVLKAQDTTLPPGSFVVIKRIPLAMMSAGPEYESPEDAEKFVDWIVEHCCASPSAGAGAHLASSPMLLTPPLEIYDRETSTDGQPEMDFGLLDEHMRLLIENGHASVRSRRRKSLGLTRGVDQIVKCLGCYHKDEDLWFALEYCEGGSISDLIRLSDGSLIEAEIGWVMSQVLLGVAYLHSRGHVHGDIKPGNILLTLEGNVKLGGTGAIMDHKEGAGDRKRRRRSLTMSEFPASWLSPEATGSSHSTVGGQTLDRTQMPEASAQSDIWALGVACIELAHGRPAKPQTPLLAPFHKQPPKTTSQDTVPTQVTGIGLSHELWEFIGKCLTLDPAQRPSAQDLLQDPFIQLHCGFKEALVGRIQSMMSFAEECSLLTVTLRDPTPSANNSKKSEPSSPFILQQNLVAEHQSLQPPPLKMPMASLSMDLDSDDDDEGLPVVWPSPKSGEEPVVPIKKRAKRPGSSQRAQRPWSFPMVRPRVDSVMDGSTFFNEAGEPMAIPTRRQSLPQSQWKHQWSSHPVIKQALLCDQAGYMTFRHSRTPSLDTIVELWNEDLIASFSASVVTSTVAPPPPPKVVSVSSLAMEVVDSDTTMSACPTRLLKDSLPTPSSSVPSLVPLPASLSTRNAPAARLPKSELVTPEKVQSTKLEPQGRVLGRLAAARAKTRLAAEGWWRRIKSTRK